MLVAMKLEDLAPQDVRSGVPFRREAISWERVDPLIRDADTPAKLRDISRQFLIRYRTLRDRRRFLGLPSFKLGRPVREGK